MMTAKIITPCRYSTFNRTVVFPNHKMSSIYGLKLRHTAATKKQYNDQKSVIPELAETIYCKNFRSYLSTASEWHRKKKPNSRPDY
jgi:hypothetical protein